MFMDCSAVNNACTGRRFRLSVIPAKAGIQRSPRGVPPLAVMPALGHGFAGATPRQPVPSLSERATPSAFPAKAGIQVPTVHHRARLVRRPTWTPASAGEAAAGRGLAPEATEHNFPYRGQPRTNPRPSPMPYLPPRPARPGAPSGGVRLVERPGNGSAGLVAGWMRRLPRGFAGRVAGRPPAGPSAFPPSALRGLKLARSRPPGESGGMPVTRLGA
jgi:hypothetical protein